LTDPNKIFYNQTAARVCLLEDNHEALPVVVIDFGGHAFFGRCGM